MEPGLVSKKEAYKKIPEMCLAYYESKYVLIFCAFILSRGNLRGTVELTLILRLIWRDTSPKPVKEEAEISNGVKNVVLSKTKSEEGGVKTEAKDAEKTKPVENEGGAAPPRAPTPVLHSYSWFIYTSMQISPPLSLNDRPVFCL